MTGGGDEGEGPGEAADPWERGLAFGRTRRMPLRQGEPDLLLQVFADGGGWRWELIDAAAPGPAEDGLIAGGRAAGPGAAMAAATEAADAFRAWLCEGGILG